jgi:hypothetical protein
VQPKGFNRDYLIKKNQENQEGYRKIFLEAWFSIVLTKKILRIKNAHFQQDLMFVLCCKICTTRGEDKGYDIL